MIWNVLKGLMGVEKEKVMGKTGVRLSECFPPGFASERDEKDWQWTSDVYPLS